MVKVKICGITNLEDALLACVSGADALGFNFYEKSPRFISPDRAREIITTLPPFVTRVGVFVNMPLESLQKLSKELDLNLVQLHGDESPEYCRALKVPFIKVFRVDEYFDWQILRKYPTRTFLLDTYRKGMYGGTGATFDWRVAREARNFGRIILSGGLTPENVAAALDAVRPYAVDVCSGVEQAPGKKDPEKLRAFMVQIHKFNHNLINSYG